LNKDEIRRKGIDDSPNVTQDITSSTGGRGFITVKADTSIQG